MFTGIVQGRGVHSIENDDAVWTFQIDVPDTSGWRGASVAINGVCLTATEISGQQWLLTSLKRR